MLYTQIEFPIFFLVLLGCLSITRNNILRKIIILLGSYYFYAYWDFRFVGLILLTTLVDYCVGKGLESTGERHKRKLFLFISLFVNLSVLFIFKYYNFFIESFQNILTPLGFNTQPLDIILPIGISFYIFKSIGYTVDVYLRRIKSCRNVLDYALFVGFFPNLLAGPIERASSFLPQLEKSPGITKENLMLGMRLFIIGLFKKVFLADRFGMFVSYFFNNAEVFASSTAWLAVIAYSLQIYLDFSGYSDMSIGLAKMMGYDLQINFNFPYLSTNITEFWRRWHISLSSWIRDYLYIPLGGNRKGRVRTYINLMTAMLLCGLWHGAAWTFIFWGGLHGLFLTCHRLVKNGWNLSEDSIFINNLALLLRWSLTMVAVAVGWVFFRSADFHQAILILAKMFYPQTGVSWHPPFVVAWILVIGVLHVFHACGLGSLFALPVKAWYTPAVLLSMLWLVILFFPAGFNPFIYFRF